MKVFKVFVTLVFAVWGWAQARTIEIVQASQLELRNVTLEDGVVQEYIILTGTPVELKIDDSTIRANRVEYNKAARELRLVGRALYITQNKNADGSSTEQTLAGEDLKVNLEIEGVEGEDVFITTQNILVKGETVQRIPGQIGVQGGYFTPCARCGRTPNDYAFTAGTMWIYPGNRLVAYDVKVLIADTPVFYLPALVFMLNKERPTRLDVGQSPIDGWTVGADLPYLFDANSFGTLALDYYQNRDVPVGFSVDHSLYNPFGLNNTSILKAKMDPKPVGQQGAYWSFDVNISGNQPGLASKNGLDYTFKTSRNDLSEFNIIPLDGEIKGEWPAFKARLTYSSLIDGDTNPQVARPGQVRKIPEFELDPNSTKIFRVTYDPRLVLGYYEAETNPRNPSARRSGERISAIRALYSHTLGYNWKPWSGADLNLNQTFTGQYFSTDERGVEQNFTANFSQTFSTGNSLNLNYTFYYSEGETPFNFDPVFRRKTHTLGTTVNLQPLPDMSVSASQKLDFEKKRDEQETASASLTYNPKPFTVTLNYRDNLFKQQSEALSGTVKFTDNSWNFSVATGYNFGNPDPSKNNPARFDPLRIDGSFTANDRAHSLSANFEYDLNKKQAVNLTGSYTFLGPIEVFDAALLQTNREDYSPATYSIKLSETYNYQTPQLSGSLDLTRAASQWNITHSLYTGEDPNRQLTGNLKATYKVDKFTLSFDSPFKLMRQGYFTRPTLTANYSQSLTGAELSAEATLNLKGIEHEYTDLKSAYLRGQWWAADFLGIQGDVAYSGSWDDPSNPKVRTDVLRLNPLTLTTTFGREGNEPQWILSASVLSQEYRWVNGEYLGPQFQPTLRLVYNRCCWSSLVEWSPNQGTFRFAVNLMQSSYRDILRGSPEGIKGPF
ncbi:hypothetical protein [Deinococcus misasensis]|uniref:hypothetical protein n=1 Tax=Deinococcus misasensis TaxID=392413 RepID=UPI00054F42C3|nr:hypothetical protein [Deinococcus misasensis]